MESSVLDNLTYLSKHLDETTARVRELEDELANTRNTASANNEIHSRILQLESENTNLRGQVSSLNDKLKVKHEKLDTMSTVKQEDDEIREAKYTELQAQLKDTAELAAKALRERLEAAKALDEARKQCADLQVANNALVLEGNASGERHAATCARLNSKIDKLKGKRTSLREACSEQDAQVQSMNNKLSRVRDKYEAVKIEQDQLKQASVCSLSLGLKLSSIFSQTMSEMIELVEKLQEDCKAKEDLATTFSSQYDETEEARSELEEASGTSL
ncbi:hypothetical protein MSAN_02257300 [Mycena sanguinolenta]|uniref:Uncharacterized protein n=1 Tax=Mycena sanguinolenta TaxID=230812 RepID=A0A8H6X9U1_9AGAR|nr:hypothetical protein MSAN_02257300 [Mycena sanguinolenta]